MLPPVVWRRAYVTFTLFVCAYSVVQHILCCVFIRLVYPMLPVSLDCPFLIVPSVFSNIYYLKYNSPFGNISEVNGKCYRRRVHVNFDDIKCDKSVIIDYCLISVTRKYYSYIQDESYIEEQTIQLWSKESDMHCSRLFQIRDMRTKCEIYVLFLSI